MEWQLEGIVETGAGRARDFTRLPWAVAGFRSAAGIDPFPGTLNVRLASATARATWAAASRRQVVHLPAGDPASCAASCRPVQLRVRDRSLPAAVVTPGVAGYPGDLLELVASVDLRATLGLRDGRAVVVTAATLPVLEAVIFDVDGTLVDSIPGYVLAAARAAEPYGIAIPANAVHRALNEDLPFWPLVLGPGPHAPELLAALMEGVRRHWPDVLREQVRCMPGLPETLDRLAAAGLALGICTASRGESLSVLADAGLSHRFAVTVTAADVRQRKPHPEGLLAAAAALGVTPERALYVGDTAVDLIAARAAGMAGVGVLTGGGDSVALSLAGALRILPDHRSLPDLLGGLVACCG